MEWRYVLRISLGLTPTIAETSARQITIALCDIEEHRHAETRNAWINHENSITEGPVPQDIDDVEDERPH